MDYPIYFVRHGETEWNVIGRFQGQHDSHLTERGREQAHAVGQILAREIDDIAPVDFVSSPLGRTLETARIALAHIGATPRHDPRLAEISVGRWTGMTFDEVCAEYPQMADVLSQ
ncbi:MAG: histidine phosphatase family protein, partial [Pseudomonadota bacterium]